MRSMADGCSDDGARTGPAVLVFGGRPIRGIGVVEYLMPLFEYDCLSCGHQFEYLTRAAQTPSCPSCESDELRKRLSAFAVGANGTSTSAGAESVGPCGSCGDPRGPGACSMN
jgi:putative FmdB family regulatory protein